MADTNDTSEQERLAAEDSAFRESMQQKRDEDPNARRWVELDEKAIDLEGQVGQDQEQLDEPGSVWDLEKSLTQARAQRDEFRQGGRPSAYASNDQKEWDKQYEDLDNNVSSVQGEFTKALQDASPEDLDKLQNQIAQRREDLVKTIEERQGIAYLPSEEAERGRGQQESDTQREDSLTDMLAARRARQEEEQGAYQDDGQEWSPEQTQPQEASLSDLRAQRNAAKDEQAAPTRLDAISSSEADLAGGGRMAYAYGAYATSSDEAAAYKQLEQDQIEFEYQNGRRSTTAELLAYQEKGGASQTLGSAAGGQIKGTDQVSAQDDESPVAQQTPGEKAELKGASTVSERKAKQEQVQEQSEEKPQQVTAAVQVQQRTQSQGMGM